MAKQGRPSKYTRKLAAEICQRIARGEGLRAICTDAHMPAIENVFDWVHDDREGFRHQYVRARETQAELFADDINRISDELPETIQTIRPDGTVENKRDPAFVAWQKNRIDARKWTASKLRPKVYGDRLAVEGEVTINVADRLEAARKRLTE